MAQLRQDYAQFTARGAEILVVCPEGLEAVQAYWQREKLPFVGLADPDHKIANRYGQEVNIFKLGRMPELVILDRAGVVRYQHNAASMSDIPTNKTVLGILDGLSAAGTTQTA